MKVKNIVFVQLYCCIAEDELWKVNLQEVDSFSN